jgi:hypothetical protein
LVGKIANRSATEASPVGTKESIRERNASPGYASTGFTLQFA